MERGNGRWSVERVARECGSGWRKWLSPLDSDLFIAGCFYYSVGSVR